MPCYFLARDPFPGLALLPQTQHDYAYVGNNPINFADPSGEFVFIPLLLVAAAGGTLGGVGYYAIQTALNPCLEWNWGQAAFWGGVGTGLGALLGTGIYGGWWVGLQFGWWGSAASGGVVAQQIAQQGLNTFSRAAEFGIRTHNQLRNAIARTGLQTHHIIERRFAGTLGLNAGEMESVALTPQEHQMFTNAWRNAIGYINSSNPTNTATATLQDVWLAAQRIYADYPARLEAARQTLFGN